MGRRLNLPSINSKVPMTAKPNDSSKVALSILFFKKCIHLVGEKDWGWWFWVMVDLSFVFGLKLNNFSLEILCSLSVCVRRKLKI